VEGDGPVGLSGTGYMAEISIRRPEPQECNAVRALVQAVVDETYGHLWAPSPLEIDEEDWTLAWIASVNGEFVGMVLTHQEWISDLWVLRHARRQGVGAKLLAQAEAEIAGQGYPSFRLRVVKSNTGAVVFYERHGWQIRREFPHEKLPTTMLEMVKLREEGRRRSIS
jgi:ribosomal protein S18 acetylase RimI-like enzyme